VIVATTRSAFTAGLRTMVVTRGMGCLDECRVRLR
jgi:hypothetical protein